MCYSSPSAVESRKFQGRCRPSPTFPTSVHFAFHLSPVFKRREKPRAVCQMATFHLGFSAASRHVSSIEPSPCNASRDAQGNEAH
ncbi:unnamed protein product [Soboliphyme baturini]|uniref:Uncharacterized protein n=1 Tax=Soboliphyme baturini TaxID=241478 RepID=A0A183IHD3_9BILA|nr:unnamed protein product [Soboliphyme baturini]